MFLGKVSSLSSGGVSERCLTLVGSNLTQKHRQGWKGFSGTSTIAFCEHLKMAD